jgi:hypothetical protein
MVVGPFESTCGGQLRRQTGAGKLEGGRVQVAEETSTGLLVVVVPSVLLLLLSDKGQDRISFQPRSLSLPWWRWRW